MSPNDWGPPIWTMFHTMAEKINPEKFRELIPQIIFFIRRICANLPCPECAGHATLFMSKVVFSNLRCKKDLQTILYFFHNVVNGRKRKPIFNQALLTEKYCNNNILVTYNNFVTAYTTKGNMKLMADSLQRNIIMQEFRKWIMANHMHFNSPT